MTATKTKTGSGLPNAKKRTGRTPEEAAEIVRTLADRYPTAECALHYDGDPWRLLVMGRLSAQCTDARVNLVCEELFRAFPDALAMANAPIEEIERIVRPCGLFRTKADNLRESARRLVTVYGGVLPDTMEALLTFPGVGRKIANLLLGDIFGKPAVVCDTHCIRICGRLGFYPVTLKDAGKVEDILRGVLDPAEGSDFCHRLVLFGREICTARAPKCGECPLAKWCVSLDKNAENDN